MVSISRSLVTVECFYNCQLNNNHMNMRNSVLSLSILFFAGLLFSGFTSCAQMEKRVSPHDTLRTKDVTVTYGRPYKKGREIFGKLEPFGKVYRCGADEATTITFAKDGTFGGKPVKAGTYTL